MGKVLICLMLQMSSCLKSDGFVATATVPKKIFSTKSAIMHILSNLLKFTCNVSVGVRPGTEWSRYQLTKANIAPSPSRYLLRTTNTGTAAVT